MILCQLCGSTIWRGNSDPIVQGQVVESGSHSELLSNPASLYTGHAVGFCMISLDLVLLFFVWILPIFSSSTVDQPALLRWGIVLELGFVWFLSLNSDCYNFYYIIVVIILPVSSLELTTRCSFCYQYPGSYRWFTLLLTPASWLLTLQEVTGGLSRSMFTTMAVAMPTTDPLQMWCMIANSSRVFSLSPLPWWWMNCFY